MRILTKSGSDLMFVFCCVLFVWSGYFFILDCCLCVCACVSVRAGSDGVTGCGSKGLLSHSAEVKASLGGQTGNARVNTCMETPERHASWRWFVCVCL